MQRVVPSREDPSALSSAPKGPARRALTAVVVSTLCAGALYLGLALWVGWDELGDALSRLGWWLPSAIPVAVLAYAIRFLRWQHLLHRAGGRVPWRESLRIYLAGFALTATPGKAGENIRSVLLLSWHVPVGTSLVLFFVERLTDLVAVLLLAAASAGIARWWWLPAATLAAGFALRAMFARDLAQRLSARLEGHTRWTWLRNLLATGGCAYVATWRVAPVLAYLAIALVAYGMQALMFAGFVHLLWPAGMLADAINIFAVSTLAGVASMIPGGIGANEITMIALLTHKGMPWPDAAAAAVGTRAVTFWFGISLGLGCLASLRGRPSPA